jgi:2',3'-cyclic-nucleotide 2'-phosphodiesterase/3'-nucleotidase/5'-nucleotidase
MSRARVLTELAALVGLLASPAEAQIQLQPIGTHSTGIFNGSASEIGAYDPATRRLFSTNFSNDTIVILDLSNPAAPTQVGTIALSGNPNSVAVCNGVVAVAVQNAVITNPGTVQFFDTSGIFVSSVTAGALPDMVTFTPNCRRLLVANEGEPSGGVDPEGSISIIDMTAGAAHLTNANVTTAGFAAFNDATLDSSIRVIGPGPGYPPGTTVAQDLEPEYIAVSHDSRTAWVTLQENNALAIVDIEGGTVTKLVGLGFKDHSVSGNGLDVSDADATNNIANWPVFGMYQPDGVAAYHDGPNTFLVMANEGDARDYEVARVNSLTLDPTAFPNAASLKLNANLGRLNVTTQNGDIDGDGDFDRLFAFGARSFSIRTSEGALVFDSGDQFEQITRSTFPGNFNATHTSNARDNRSDDKGPEPEGVTIGKAFGRTYAFITLERIGGVMVYDISNPFAPVFVQYLNNRNFSQAPGVNAGGDLGPEGLVFVRADDSPDGTPLLIVSNEVSGTTTIYQISKTP